MLHIHALLVTLGACGHQFDPNSTLDDQASNPLYHKVQGASCLEGIPQIGTTVFKSMCTDCDVVAVDVKNSAVDFGHHAVDVHVDRFKFVDHVNRRWNSGPQKFAKAGAPPTSCTEKELVLDGCTKMTVNGRGDPRSDVALPKGQVRAPAPTRTPPR